VNKAKGEIMGDKSQDTGTSGGQDKDNGPTLSNSDVKAHPLFQKLTGELAEERKSRKAMQERIDALEADENKRQTKAAEAKKDYEKALESRLSQAKKDARKEWDAEQAIRDKKSEARLQLVKAGFKNDDWINGRMAKFDHENMTPEDFAKAAVDDDTCKSFLDTGKSVKNPDPHPLTRSGSKILTPAEIQALRESGKPEDIARANDAAEALWVANNGTTGLPT
jgi:hypothetical protein